MGAGRWGGDDGWHGKWRADANSPSALYNANRKREPRCIFRQRLLQTSLIRIGGVRLESSVAEILLQNLGEEHMQPIVLRYTLGQG